jgi:hypothetical protein
MTRTSQAASTTSRITVANPLSARIRATCVSSRSSSRKLPPVIRMFAAAAPASASRSASSVAADRAVPLSLGR